MNDRVIKMGIWTAALAISLVAVRAGAQTGGQMTAARSLAGQANGGSSSSTPASSSRTSRTGVKAAARVSSASVVQAAEAARAAAAAPGAATEQMAQSANQEPAASGVRRDPFRPLVIKAKGDALPARLPPGKPGLVIGQLTIQGIVRGLDGRWIAVVDNKTKRAYFLYAGDDLYNGSVSRITADSVVFAEKFTDPMGRQSSREVVKQLAR